MRLEEVIVSPVLTEKANKLSEKSDSYVFKVAKQANKIEIKNAIEKFYNVKIADVRTLVNPSKIKARMTKKGYLVGRKPSYKKAIVTVNKGEKIDFYSEI